MRSLALSMMAAAVAVLAAAGSASAATPAHKGGGGGHGGGGGTGGAPASISISPGSMTFGPQEVGTESAPQFFTITNTGSSTADVYVSYAAAVGTSSDGSFNSLANATNPCDEPSDLAPGASCTEPVSFAPLGSGTLTETMNVSVGEFAGTPVASATITGTAFEGPTASEMTISPSSLSFPAEYIDGGESPPQTVTVTNSSSLPAIVNAYPGGDLGYVPGSDTCDDVTLAPGESCTIDVVFVPGTQGPITTAFGVQVGGYPDVSSTSIPATGEGLGELVDQVTVSADTVTSGGTLTGTVQLGDVDSTDCVDTNADQPVDLIPFNSAITVPAQVVVPAGQCEVSFPVTANAVSAATVTNFSAIAAQEGEPEVNAIPSPLITVEP
jgi:hypothetical protein